jgi:hypothetical protein
VVRVVTSEYATSRACSASASRAESASALARSAAVDRADNTSGTAASCVSGSPSTEDSAGADGASSSTRCALVPLNPNEDTPARRGSASRGHGWASVSTRTGPTDQSTCSVGSSTWRVFGSMPCRSASTILMTLAIPAAACVCPMFDLTEPSHSGRSRSRP